MEPIYFTADADHWCRDCILATYGGTDAEDREGNPIGAVFPTDEGPDYCPHCNACGQELEASCRCSEDVDSESEAA